MKLKKPATTFIVAIALFAGGAGMAAAVDTGAEPVESTDALADDPDFSAHDDPDAIVDGS